MAWVRQRGGRWYVRYRDEHGRKVERVIRHAKNQTQAKRDAAELERNAERVRLGLERPTTKDITFAEGVAKYLAALPPDYASRGALESRLHGRILPHLGKMYVRRITKADVQAMLAANADVSPQSREHLRVAVQGTFTFLIGAKLATENPAREVGKLPIPERLPRFLTLEELPQLMAQVPEQWRAAVLVALGTGVRKGELLALRKADVLLDARFIVVRGSHGRDTTKTGRERQVPIPLGLVPVLQEQLRTARGALLFPNPEGKPWSKTVRLHEIIRRALCRAGLVVGFDVACKGWGKKKGCGFAEHHESRGSRYCPECGNTLRVVPVAKPIRFKELRSTFATHMTAGTGDIRVVQKILGHGDVNVTARRYAFAMPSHLQAQVDSVALLPATALPPTSDQPARRGTSPEKASAEKDQSGRDDARADDSR